MAKTYYHTLTVEGLAAHLGDFKNEVIIFPENNNDIILFPEDDKLRTVMTETYIDNDEERSTTYSFHSFEPFPIVVLSALSKAYPEVVLTLETEDELDKYSHWVFERGLPL